MFADSLLESVPHAGHRAAWTKLVSTLLQATALAIAFTVPLFHMEQLRVTPPAPSIQMTSPRAQAPVEPRTTQITSEGLSIATNQLLAPRHIPRTIPPGDDRSPAPSGEGFIPCISNCDSGLITNIVSAGPAMIPRPLAPSPSRPINVSVMQLGDLVHKVLPEYPIIAKQLRVQGAVVLLATIGKNGKVEQVRAVSGPPLLQAAAKAAVEQWQYRPYILNHEPIEVQTQITVNFVLNKE